MIVPEAGISIEGLWEIPRYPLFGELIHILLQLTLFGWSRERGSTGCWENARSRSQVSPESALDYYQRRHKFFEDRCGAGKDVRLRVGIDN